MIESALVFALGLLTAGFLALLLFPAFNRRAVRLAWREAEARLPRNMNEITAARDAVRAVYAAKVARAEVEARESRDALMDERLARAEVEAQLAAARSEKSALSTALNETEARLAHAHELIRGREEALAQANADIRELERRAAADAGKIRSAERRIQDLEASLERLRAEARPITTPADWTHEGGLDPVTTRLAAKGDELRLPAPEPDGPRSPDARPLEPVASLASPLSAVLRSLQTERSRLELETRHLGLGRSPSEPVGGPDRPSDPPVLRDAAAAVMPLLTPPLPAVASAAELGSDDADALVARPRINELARRIRLGRERVAVAEELDAVPLGKATDPEA